MGELLAPEVRDIEEEAVPGVPGHYHQKFVLFMPGVPDAEYPFDRVGQKIDLSDPQVRIDLWKTLKHTDDGD